VSIDTQNAAENNHKNLIAIRHLQVYNAVMERHAEARPGRRGRRCLPATALSMAIDMAMPHDRQGSAAKWVEA